jgi:signal transduction histidine kinase/CheY-like chemotaxis protein
MRMPFGSFGSIRRKLFAGVMLTSVVALLVSGASLFLYDLHTHRQTTSTDLAIQAELLGSASAAALQFDDAVVAAQNLAFLQARPSIRMAAIYHPGGGVFASYARPDMGAAKFPALAGAAGITITGDRITVIHRIVEGKEAVGSVYLEADLGLYKRIASYAAIALGVMLIALLVSTLLTAWLQRGITRPIIHISDLAREVVKKRDYTVRANRTTNDEIGSLVDAFNEMLSEIERRTQALEASGAEVSRLNKDLERRVAERTAQLEESNAQLKAANAAKSSFLSTMSHEIRTPMNGVLGMLELLSLSELDGQQRGTLGIVRESGRSLLRIIDDILDFSKIEAGKLEVRPEVASVPKVIGSVVGIYSGNASSKGLLLKSAVDPRISPAVLVDPLRLQQILNNLVSNAIKFTSKGCVEIRAALVERRGKEDLVEFSVTDTGMGISPAALAGLFEPFAQAGSEIARVYGGTGLGLSICQRLAKLMGASIAVKSELGKGTTMSVTFPLPIADPQALPNLGGENARELLAPAGRTPRAPPSVAEAEAEGTLVLVVDDHPINRLVLIRQVTALGYASESAEDGVQALALWKTNRFGLVITDCNMPEMDGYELARAIRALELANAQKRTVIVACTANALRGDAENCFAAGMDDYLAKPVELVQLRRKLDLWLPVPSSDEAATAQAGPRSDASQARNDAARPPLDQAVLTEISGNDPGLEREIVAQFLRANEEDAALIARAMEMHDIALVTRGAHRMKGATATLGATLLADVCARMESAARADDWQAVVACMDSYHRELSRLNAYLQGVSMLSNARV